MVGRAGDPVVLGGGGGVADPGEILSVAVRAYTPPKEPPKPHRLQPWPSPDVPVLVFDTESRTTPDQRLTFGCWRVLERGETVDEGLFFGDDLPATDLALLEDYARTHRAATAEPELLRLLLRRQFLAQVLWKHAYKTRGPIVGFNLPFDWGRLATGWGEARGDFYAGGFSLVLWDYERGGVRRENKHRPRLAIKSIDSKRALTGLLKRLSPDPEDLIPEDSADGKPDPSYVFPGHFLDLRTLAFALTNEAHSLASACRAFGVEHGKLAVGEHGVVTAEYVDYARRDVLATSELLDKLLAEYGRHPIALPPTRAFSPASIGKAYLRAMAIQPILERQPDFPVETLGHAMVAYYGGRAECRIRKVPVPVVYLDFLSMYPTVNTLMGLWRVLTAKRIDIEDATEEARELLASVDLDRCFDPAWWRSCRCWCWSSPRRTCCQSEQGTARATPGRSGSTSSSRASPRWHTLADCVASALLAGKPPNVLRAVRLVPSEERLPGLTPVALRGTVRVEPGTVDFFRAVIEQRKSLPEDLPEEERRRLDQFLKVLANSTSYGIFAEMNRQDERAESSCTGSTSNRSRPTSPGRRSRATSASAAGRLHRRGGAPDARHARAVRGGPGRDLRDGRHRLHGNRRHRGGRADSVPGRKWAGEEDGGNPGADMGTGRGHPAALRRAQPLRSREDRRERAATRGRQPRRGRGQRPLSCLAISAKRYCLYAVDDRGEPELVKWSEHGLGHLLNPTVPDSEDRDWMRQLWEGIVREELGLLHSWPAWLDRPALSRLTISGPDLLEPFTGLNAGKAYPDQVKPFNFLLAAHVARFGHPDGADPARFQLFAPYEADPRQWERLPWVDRYSGERYRISTTAQTGGPGVARVQTYRDVLEDFQHHPEAKSAGSDGQPCTRQTVGLLQRRRVGTVPELLAYVGKESNRLEEVEAGLGHDPDEVYTQYADPGREPWRPLVLPVLKHIPAKRLTEDTGLAMSTVKAARNGHTVPRRPKPRDSGTGRDEIRT